MPAEDMTPPAQTDKIFGSATRPLVAAAADLTHRIVKLLEEKERREQQKERVRNLESIKP
jgi:7-keto-8-aminopelargonate synthetase-like enzyme